MRLPFRLSPALGSSLFALLLLLAAACSDGAGPDGSSAPVIVITQPVGTQRAVIPLDYLVTDSGSDSASVVMEFSPNGGGTWSPATRSGTLGDDPTRLSTSPTGVKHTFMWAALADGVATSGALSTVRFRMTPADTEVGTTIATAPFTVDNNQQQVIGVASSTFPRNGSVERTAEVALGDLVTDALRARAGTQLAIISGGTLRSPLPSSFVVTNGSLRRTGPGPFDLVMGDVYTLLPFSNRLVTHTVTGAVLWQALERSVGFLPAANGAFLQISGFSFTYDPAAASGSRVRSVTLAGGGAIAANATTYTLALNDFLNSGGDGYGMLVDPAGVVREVLADVVLEYIIAAATITPSTTGRITATP